MSKKVLICDDEPYILEAVQHVVQKEGFQTVTAEDGIKGLEAALREVPDLLIVDAMMPGKSGYDVCKGVRDEMPDKDIFIIMLTARGQEADRQMGLDSGADEYMTKPFSPRKLRARLHEILG